MSFELQNAFILLLHLDKSSSEDPRLIQSVNVINRSELIQDLLKRNLIGTKEQDIWLTEEGQNFVNNLLAIPLPQISIDTDSKEELDDIDKALIDLIGQIDQEEYCAGLVPLDLLAPQAQKKLEVNLQSLHERLINLEKNRKIYFEAINDPGRLVGDQRAYALTSETRGVLFYVGRWQ
ncbi:MAG: hypothetical protein ACXAC7_18230 [Candidatus Hodarchaeales archaeon]|jgi:hypothetical protein